MVRLPPELVFPMQAIPTVLFLSALAAASGCQGPEPRAPVDPSSPPFAFVVEALSRGAGVPDAARQALGESRRILDAAERDHPGITFSESRIGIEGETRLVVLCRDPAAGRDVFHAIQQLAEGVDLLNVREAPDLTPSAQDPVPGPDS